MDLVKARKLYFDPREKGSLSSRKTFKKYHPKIPDSVLDRLFGQDGTVQQWFPAKKSIPGERMSMVANYFSEKLQMDTGFFKIKQARNAKLVPVLGIVDVWSRAFYARVLARATAAEVLTALADIVEKDIIPHRTLTHLPISFVSDKGKEFDNAKLSRWLSDNNYRLYTLSSSTSKAAIVERKWRTLKVKIQLYLSSMKIGEVFNFKDVLSALIQSLNETSSRSIGGVSPIDLVNNNYYAIDKMRRATKPELYWSEDQRFAFFKGVQRRVIASPGNYVRVTTKSETFLKLTQRAYSKNELFIVDNVRLPTPSMGTKYSMYRLRDTNQELIEGLFLTSEIIPVKDHLSPKNPNYRYHVLKWKKASMGMYHVSYSELYPGNSQLVSKKTLLRQKFTGKKPK